jgi:hypothetical protein
MLKSEFCQRSRLWRCGGDCSQVHILVYSYTSAGQEPAILYGTGARPIGVSCVYEYQLAAQIDRGEVDGPPISPKSDKFTFKQNVAGLDSITLVEALRHICDPTSDHRNSSTHSVPDAIASTVIPLRRLTSPKQKAEDHNSHCT